MEGDWDSCLDQEEDLLLELLEDEGVGAMFGLVEIPGSIGIDSCASDNVMSKRMIKCLNSVILLT